MIMSDLDEILYVFVALLFQIYFFSVPLFPTISSLPEKSKLGNVYYMGLAL